MQLSSQFYQNTVSLDKITIPDWTERKKVKAE